MQKLIDQIKQAGRVLLLSHINPDGDAVGSLLGLSLALEEMGKTVFPCLHDPVPAAYQGYLQGWQKISNQLPDAAEVDLCIVIDLSTSNRTGFTDFVQELHRQHKVGVIDHHPAGDLGTAEGIVHDIEASSASELVMRVLPELGVRLTPAIATALLTGIYTDTGGFQYSNTTPQALELGGELVRRGARLQPIVKAMEGSRSLVDLKLLGLALERAMKRCDGQCIVTLISRDDYASLGIEDPEPIGLVGQFNDVNEGRFVLLLSEAQEGTIRGMLRNNNQNSTFKVNRLARIMGGGGHDKAAGFSLPGHIKQQGADWKITPL